MAELQKKQSVILVIDDEEIIRETFSFFLEDFGFSVMKASNGLEGLEIFQSNPIDLVLTDLIMPRMNGLEVLKKIKKISPETPQIVCSGTGVIGDAVEALQSGAWGYLLKPIENFSIMLHSIKSALEKAELIRDNKEYQEHLESQTKELKKSLDTLKKTQSRLIESEKMAALGSLVAGVSHEINTPIGIGITIASHITERAQVIKSKYRENALSSKDFEEFIETVSESSAILQMNMNHAGNLIHSFKQVAVDQSSEEKRSFQICRYLDEVLTSLRSEYKKGGHIIKVFCPVSLTIESYPGAFSQIITNLILNSVHHGFKNKEGGKISINIKKTQSGLELTFRDNGIGIPRENIKRVFEPFFTTERAGEGSGLGLNIVYNLITQTLGGTIECFSIEGEGTTFKMTLPF